MDSSTVPASAPRSGEWALDDPSKAATPSSFRLSEPRLAMIAGAKPPAGCSIRPNAQTSPAIAPTAARRPT